MIHPRGRHRDKCSQAHVIGVRRVLSICLNNVTDPLCAFLIYRSGLRGHGSRGEKIFQDARTTGATRGPRRRCNGLRRCGHRPRVLWIPRHDRRPRRRGRRRRVRRGGRRLPRASRVEQSQAQGRRGGRREEGRLPHQARSVHFQRRVRADGRGPHALRRAPERAGGEAGGGARPLSPRQRRRFRVQRRRRRRRRRRERRERRGKRTRARQVQSHAPGGVDVPADARAADGDGRVRGAGDQGGGSPRPARAADRIV